MNDYNTKTRVLTLDQGTDFDLRLELEGADALPMDTTGWVITSKFKTEQFSKTSVLSFSTSNGTITNDGSGVVTLKFTDAMTRPLRRSQMSGFFDVLAETPSGVHQVLISGTYAVNALVSN